MKKLAFAIMAAFWAVLCFQGCSPCSGVEDAIEKLESEDQLEVREGIRSLAQIEHSPCAAMAVDPLRKILEGERSDLDIFTRSLAATSLASIAKTSPDWTTARPAAHPLIDTLFHDSSDLLRARVALALGGCGWTQARTPLSAASVSDSSDLVRIAAGKALESMPADPSAAPSAASTASHMDSLTSASYPAQDTLTGELKPPEETVRCITRSQRRIIEKHAILLDSDLAALPPCEE